jgi:hypothetical protein
METTTKTRNTAPKFENFAVKNRVANFSFTADFCPALAGADFEADVDKFVQAAHDRLLTSALKAEVIAAIARCDKANAEATKAGQAWDYEKAFKAELLALANDTLQRREGDGEPQEKPLWQYECAALIEAGHLPYLHKVFARFVRVETEKGKFPIAPIVDNASLLAAYSLLRSRKGVIHTVDGKQIPSGDAVTTAITQRADNGVSAAKALTAYVAGKQTAVDGLFE